MAKEHTDLERTIQEVGTLQFDVTIPPSVNAMYYNTRSGSRRKTAMAENYERDMKAHINQVVEDSMWIKPDKGVWLYIDMVFYFPDRVVRDSHNCLKILMDVMQGNVYVNDYSAMPRIMSVEFDKRNPRVEITVHPQTIQLREVYTNGKLIMS